MLEFIATNITDNIRVLEGALIRVAAFASLTAEQLTVETAAPVLGDLLTARQPRPITPAGDPRRHLEDVRHPRSRRSSARSASARS